MKDAAFRIWQAPAGRHAPVVGASMAVARRDQQPPAVLASAVAPEPEALRAGPPHDREHEPASASSSPATARMACCSCAVRTADRRQVAFVHRIERHCRAVTS